VQAPNYSFETPDDG